MRCRQRISMAVMAILLFLSAISRASAAMEAVNLVSWQVTVGGKTISLMGASGELARMEAEGKTFALAPEVDNPAAGVVTFRLIEITKVDAENEMLKQVEKFSLRPGAAYSTAWQPRLTILLDGVSTAEGDASAKPAPVAETLVYWVVRVPSSGEEQKEIKFVGKNGELARLEGPDLTLGFRPKVQDSKVNFEVYQILQAQGEGEILKEIGNYTLPDGGEVNSRKPSFFLKLTQIAAAGY